MFAPAAYVRERLPEQSKVLTCKRGTVAKGFLHNNMPPLPKGRGTAEWRWRDIFEFFTNSISPSHGFAATAPFRQGGLWLGSSAFRQGALLSANQNPYKPRFFTLHRLSLYFKLIDIEENITYNKPWY